MAPLYRKAIHFYDCKTMEQILQCIISKNEFQSESTVFSRWQIKTLQKIDIIQSNIEVFKSKMKNSLSKKGQVILSE